MASDHRQVSQESLCDFAAEFLMRSCTILELGLLFLKHFLAVIPEGFLTGVNAGTYINTKSHFKTHHLIWHVRAIVILAWNLKGGYT